MTATERKTRMVRLQTALLLVAMFAVGAVAGAGLYRWGAAGPPPGPLRPMLGPRALDELQLSAGQLRQVRAIFERHRPELDAILQQTYPKVRAITEKTEAEVRVILTDEQRRLFDERNAQKPPPPLPGMPPSAPSHPGMHPKGSPAFGAPFGPPPDR